ncbi:alpha/beta hydrolase fold domain-containing protein [uncultured Amnibacterium sp.]|uniref:alpha/beta hydrolase fold domain-containing protein n=1 Tax=uncultured Amnibacterium sp. TaxID=1631851 RepID=UPI0035C954B9
MSTVLRDVVFAERIGFRPLSLDLHLPEAAPAPVVLFLHGGGWRLGSRRAFVPHRSADETLGRITAAGFAVASADYRLSGEARFPAQVDDVLAAIGWVREHGAEHGLDPARIVLWGESAGAHLAALAALDPAAGVAGVVDWYGPADLTALGRDLRPDDPAAVDDDPASREAGLLGGPVSALPDLARAASPALQVHAGAPPFLLQHGEADVLVPFAQSRALADALARVGADVELVGVPGASHFWQGVDDLEPIVERALAFARRVTAQPPR